MLVYAFGTDLEVSQLSDVRSERRYLEAHHTGWKELCSFIRGQLRAARPAPNDFGSTLAFVEGLTGEYGRWQNNDCRTAADRFASLPGAKAHGRVPVAGLTPGPQWGRRAILREDGDEMTRLGVVENDTATGKPQLLVPNYLLSQAPRPCALFADLVLGADVLGRLAPMSPEHVNPGPHHARACVVMCPGTLVRPPCYELGGPMSELFAVRDAA